MKQKTVKYTQPPRRLTPRVNQAVGSVAKAPPAWTNKDCVVCMAEVLAGLSWIA